MALEALSDGTTPTPKPAWQSKTLWVNLILAVMAFIPGSSEWYHANPEIVAMVFAVANFVLRFITTKPIQIT